VLPLTCYVSPSDGLSVQLRGTASSQVVRQADR
jgi:hypothetical protein